MENYFNGMINKKLGQFLSKMSVFAETLINIGISKP